MYMCYMYYIVYIYIYIYIIYIYIYVYVYIYKLCMSSTHVKIYISNTRHLFLQELHFGFLETFKDFSLFYRVFEGMEKAEI